jgi:hypothetical protein
MTDSIPVIYFYGHTPKSNGYHVFSNFFPCTFTDSDGIVYNCNEQYMMAQKAKKFNDTESLNKILSNDDPKKIKLLGRQVKNFDGVIWNECRYDVVLEGALLKFSQNKQLKKILLDTGNSILAEASKYDSIWGIGYDKTTAIFINDQS